MGLVEQLKSAAAEAGLPVTDQLQPEGGAGEQPHAGTHSVVLTPGSVRADGAVVLALLQRQPLVAANWLLQWPQRKVWQQGEQPEAGSYPVQVRGVGRAARCGPEDRLAVPAPPTHAPGWAGVSRACPLLGLSSC